MKTCCMRHGPSSLNNNGFRSISRRVFKPGAQGAPGSLPGNEQTAEGCASASRSPPSRTGGGPKRLTTICDVTYTRFSPRTWGPSRAWWLTNHARQSWRTDTHRACMYDIYLRHLCCIISRLERNVGFCGKPQAVNHVTMRIERRLVQGMRTPVTRKS